MHAGGGRLSDVVRVAGQVGDAVGEGVGDEIQLTPSKSLEPNKSLTRKQENEQDSSNYGKGQSWTPVFARLCDRLSTFLNLN